MERIAIYPGSFDPITNGHLDVIKRASKLFDKVIVAVLANPSKTPLLTTEERLALISSAVDPEKVLVESFNGLLADYVKGKNLNAVIRSLRATSDFDYEFQMAVMNKELNPGMESVFLMTSKENFFLSSSAVKEIARLGGDISEMVPSGVAKKLLDKYSQD